MIIAEEMGGGGDLSANEMACKEESLNCLNERHYCYNRMVDFLYTIPSAQHLLQSRVWSNTVLLCVCNVLHSCI